MADDSTAIEGDVMMPQVLAMPPASRQRIVVHSDVSIMDTAKFEHLGRIANLMAEAGLMPETLTFTGPKDKRVALPFEVIRARAFLITAQADRWQMDPLAVMGCCSLVHNKLMYEGKLVSAVLEARLGVRLSYEFGAWDLQKKRVMIDVEANEKLLGVVVSGLLPGETKPRSIEGYVGLWETSGTNSPWGSPGNWRRQLRYRGAREWANAYSSGVILGVLTDDDIDESETRAEVASAQAPTLDAAFGAPKAVTARAAKPKPAVDTKVNTEAHDPKTGEVTETVDPQQQAAAQSAEPDRATKESATGASGASAAATSSPGEQDKPLGVGAVIDPGVKVSEGYPAPKEIYHLAGDLGWLASDGKWKTFQDGEPFSRAAGRAGLKVYVEHAPKAAISDGGERIDDAQREADEDGFPGDKAPTQTKGPGYNVDALNAYAAAVRKLTLGVDVARYVAMFRTSDAFKKAPPEIQRQALTLAYNHTVEIDPDCQPATNPALFRLWLVQCEAHQARDMFSRLIRSKEYDGLSDAEKDEIADEVEAVAGE